VVFNVVYLFVLRCCSGLGPVWVWLVGCWFAFRLVLELLCFDLRGGWWVFTGSLLVVWWFSCLFMMC